MVVGDDDQLIMRFQGAREANFTEFRNTFSNVTEMHLTHNFRSTKQIVTFVQKLRSMDLLKLPGVAETIDWTNALVQLDKIDLDPETVNDTLGTLLKYQDDIEKIKGSEAANLLEQVKADLAAR